MSDLNWYRLDPIDLLLMREAKPFSPGDGSWAKGQFPPLPITVFQAMRSATPWIGNKSNRRQPENWLEFVGPFLLYAPPEEAATLWLPTPQDLVCVCDRKQTQDEDPEADDFTKMAVRWKRTARFQPLDRENIAWKHLGLDPDFFPKEQLVPMVPPMRLDGEGSASVQNLNTCLRKVSPVQETPEIWEGISGRPKPWIRADALIRYLKGEVIEHSDDEAGAFHDNPWRTQVLPHIKVQPGTRQVKDEDGYFTEVAIRMEPHWHLVAGISIKLEAKVVRLGGEGHRAIVSLMEEAPPSWEELQTFRAPGTAQDTAYVLTPGLAEVTTDSEKFGLVPESWQASLRSCVGDRPLLWGGMSVFQRPKRPEQKAEGAQDKAETPKDIAFQPQRAFVPPGTVYRFQTGQVPTEFQSSDGEPKLLPRNGGNWLDTFNALNYGILLWGQ
ncbi:MAG: type III-B CRISPR module-associated Cmr3 family protein [Cyanobacteria bacterium P01_G01_bin.54]